MVPNIPAKISLCTIVKNEENNHAGGIADFLDESLPFVNEAIIVDTGSRDRTRAVLESYSRRVPNLRVFDARWQGFAHARNYSLDQARSDWILILDADERLTIDEYLKINYLIQTQDVDGFYVSFTTKDRNGIELGRCESKDENRIELSGDVLPTVTMPTIRLFRKTRLDGLRHRYLSTPNNKEEEPKERLNYIGGKYKAANITIFHYLPTLEEQELEMLERHIIEPPANRIPLGRIQPEKLYN